MTSGKTILFPPFLLNLLTYFVAFSEIERKDRGAHMKNLVNHHKFLKNSVNLCGSKQVCFALIVSIIIILGFLYFISANGPI